MHHPNSGFPRGEGLIEKSFEVLARPFAVKTDEVDLPRRVLHGFHSDFCFGPLGRFPEHLDLRQRNPETLTGDFNLCARSSKLAELALATDGEADACANLESIGGFHGCPVLANLETQSLVAQLLQPPPAEDLVLLGRPLQPGDGLVELVFGSPPELFTFLREFLWQLTSFALEPFELAPGIAERLFGLTPLQPEFETLLLELFFENLEPPEPVIELEMFRHQGVRARDPGPLSTPPCDGRSRGPEIGRAAPC